MPGGHRRLRGLLEGLGGADGEAFEVHSVINWSLDSGNR
jgi:hypothetical protein